MVRRGQLSAITASGLFLLHLRGSRCYVTLVLRGELLLRRPGLHSVRSPVVTHPCDLGVVDYRLVVDVNIGDIDVADGAIVVEIITSPVSAVVA